MRGLGRVKGLGRCWKFKWGWLIVERVWRRVKVLRGCCKFKWRKMNGMGTMGFKAGRKWGLRALLGGEEVLKMYRVRRRM